MSNLRNILNEDSSSPPSNGSRNSSSNSSPIDSQPVRGALSPDSRGLERMSLDFVAPGSRPAPHRAGSQSSYHAGGYAHYSYGADYATHSMPIRSHQVQHVQPQYSNAYTASAQHSPWTSVNSSPSYRRASTAGSTTYSDGELIDTSDPDSPSGYPQRHSPAGSSRSARADPPRREPRHTYGEEERAFIMVCAILRGMTWKEIEKEFCERFPAGQKRRHQETGLWPTYPEQERTAGGLTCAYYRIREQWGIPKVRGVSDEQKPEVKSVVKKAIMNMHDFPDLQNFVERCR
ncbi:hypothetical protein UCRNP2_6884 [Neofusicoccum parvum UCRNP2]|uniref:Uncharacterized protein n=2 Tax=Neofusicoccum parvum TaxID=310453 RepID=R1G4P2_BOTPV|nr:hypothetical protein UCRNP2_6884 [Neofusicoccum parvum UCRNP2]GME36385.1 uncharacterized protein LTHEOB_1175 [Neofusicoccum parvum]